MLALAADLLGVGLHRLVAVVAVGDQQLGVGRCLLHCRDRLGRRDPPQAVAGAVGVGHVLERWAVGRGRQRLPGDLGGVGVKREDGGDVRPRGSREPQAVLLGAGVRALVRSHATGAVRFDSHAAEEAPPGQPLAVWPRVVLQVRPQRRLAVAHQRTLQLPALEQLARGLIGVGVALREIDRHHVERRAGDQRGALGSVDDVIWRRHHACQRTYHGGVVAKRSQRLYIGHGGWLTLAAGAGRTCGRTSRRQFRPKPARTCVRNGSSGIPA